MLPTENFAGIGIRTRDLRGDSQHSDHNIQKATSLLLLFIIIEKVDVDFGMGGQSQLIVLGTRKTYQLHDGCVPNHRRLNIPKFHFKFLCIADANEKNFDVLGIEPEQPSSQAPI